MSFVDPPLPGIIVEPNGQTVSVTITSTVTGATPTVYSDPFAVNTVSMPKTISARTTFYLPDEGPWTVNGQSVTLEDTQVATINIPIPVLSAAATVNEYWVSRGSVASDYNNPGTQYAPFATIAKALTALGSNPGVIHLGYGEFDCSATINFNSNMRLTGVGYPGNVDNTGTVINLSTLKWTGAANGTLLEAFDVEYVEIDHVGMSDGGVSGLTFLLVESDNNPATHNIHLHHFTMQCNSLGTAIGIDVCPSGTTHNYQADRVWIEHGTVYSCGTGFRCQSSNAMDLGGLRDVTFYQYTTAMNFVGMGPMVVDSCVGGTTGGTFISITPGFSNNVSFRNLESEGATYDLNISGGSAELTCVFQFISCTFNGPILVNQTVDIQSEACVVDGTFTLGSTGTPMWVSMFDYFANTPTINSGSLIQHGRSANSRYQIVATNSAGASSMTMQPSATNGGIEIAGSTGSNPWQLISSGTSGLNPGGMVIRQATGGVDPIYIDSAPIEASLRLSAAGCQVGKASPATNATTGFPYIPSASGAPTGTPSAVSGMTPMYYDTSNHKIWFYDGTWKGVTVS